MLLRKCDLGAFGEPIDVPLEVSCGWLSGSEVDDNGDECGRDQQSESTEGAEKSCEWGLRPECADDDVAANEKEREAGAENLVFEEGSKWIAGLETGDGRRHSKRRENDPGDEHRWEERSVEDVVEQEGADQDGDDANDCGYDAFQVHVSSFML